MLLDVAVDGEEDDGDGSVEKCILENEIGREERLLALFVGYVPLVFVNAR